MYSKSPIQNMLLCVFVCLLFLGCFMWMFDYGERVEACFIFIIVFKSVFSWSALAYHETQSLNKPMLEDVTVNFWSLEV